MKRLMLMFCLALASHCQAAPFGAKDKEKIHATIRNLLDSLKKGDIAAAYAMNTEETRKSFGTAGNFQMMFKKHYLPLYRHDTATVTSMTNLTKAVAVTTLIIDRDGEQWNAVFLMKPHAQTWLIDSCVLVQAPVQEHRSI